MDWILLLELAAAMAFVAVLAVWDARRGGESQ